MEKLRGIVCLEMEATRNGGEKMTNTASLFSLEEEDDNDEFKIIKRRISCHPLYQLLTQTHLECLKVSMGAMEEVGGASEPDQTKQLSSTSMSSKSELDHFMETYCMALRDLKEGMSVPIQETTTFVDSMHLQLMELMNSNTQPSNTTSPISSGEKISRAYCLIQTRNDEKGCPGERKD